MKNVWIFGDSYADKMYNNACIENWPKLLEKNYNVKNFAIAGSGPEYSINTLYNEVEKIGADDAKKITIIFFISEVSRYNFSFLYTHEQCLIKFASLDKLDKQHKHISSSRSLKDKTKISFIKDFFRDYHLNQPDEIQYLKILGTLKILSNRFEKVLCIPCFSQIPDYVSTNTDNFYLFSHIPFYMIDDENFNFGQDPRSNHLANAKHPVFYEQLKNWIDFNIPIDIEKIKNNK
jgi:hypothetical protein